MGIRILLRNGKERSFIARACRKSNFWFLLKLEYVRTVFHVTVYSLYLPLALAKEMVF